MWDKYDIAMNYVISLSGSSGQKYHKNVEGLFVLQTAEYLIRILPKYFIDSIWWVIPWNVMAVYGFKIASVQTFTTIIMIII